MQRSNQSAGKWSLMAVLLLIALSGGCAAKLISTLNYAINGPPKVPAVFDKFPDKRVAVVCVSQADLFGAGGVARTIARNVERLLEQEVEDIDIVGQDAIDNWQDTTEGSAISLDYKQIGKAVKADYVLVVDINAPITLKEGPTLFKGRADFTVSVYDMASNSSPVLVRQNPEFAWPSNGRYGLSERAFERLFLAKLSEHVARYFHAYEPNAEIGLESVE